MPSFQLGERVHDTSEIPTDMEPIFCQKCGGRIGWVTDHVEPEAALLCDDCLGELIRG